MYTFVKFDVSEYFDDCCDEIGTELDAAGIELNYRNHIKEPVIIAADPEQLKRVINNIISNSVKYMAEGRKGKIDIDLYDESDYVHIIIADNGKGIAGKDVSHIFERFYRTDESRNSKQGGSGIGLAVAKSIAQLHNGALIIESRGEGKGTCVRAMLSYDIPAGKNLSAPDNEYNSSDMQCLLTQLSGCLTLDCYSEFLED